MRKIVFVLVAIILFASLATAQNAKLPPALAEMVETEREFARFSVQHGQPEAWIEYFSDDGVIFQPAPVNVKQFMQQFLPTPNPAPNSIDWVPMRGDVSASGNMGYNIGPWKITDHTKKETDAWGYFFSVWKKQPDGKWRVVVDFGIRVPEPTADHELKVAFTPVTQINSRTPATINRESEGAWLSQLDSKFEKANAGNLVDVYLAAVDDDATILRSRIPAGKKEIMRAVLSGANTSLKLTPLKADVSDSGDLGYTYGQYEIREKETKKETGYYAHMWKRDTTGAWKIVVSNFKPLPPAPPKQ